MLVSVSRRVLSRFIVPYCFIFSTIILFFVLIYIFSVLHQRAVCCVFCPTGVGGPTLHPCLSNFYQNVGFLPSRLIFHSLRPCRASGIYLMWESLFMKFVSFLQTEPSIYCFWKAFVYNGRQENLHCIVLCCLPLMRCPYHKWRCISYTELCKDQTKVEVRKYGKVGSYQVWHYRHD